MSTRAGEQLVSAVLCACEQTDRLGNVLESLCRQTLGLDTFEVVVVDCGPEGHARSVARSFESKLPLRYSHEPGAGVASARNSGISLAAGEVVVFLREEALADPGLLEAHRDAHHRSSDANSVVLGLTKLDPSVASDPLACFVTQAEGSPLCCRELEQVESLDFSHFHGGCFSFKRSLLVNDRAFDPTFRSGGDDVELVWRLSRQGLKLVYERRAVTTIASTIGFDEFCEMMRRDGRGRFVFSQLHHDQAVQKWANVAAAGRSWRKIRHVYDAIIRSARELDRIVRLRLEGGLHVREHEMMLLHRGYWSALFACSYKGIAEQAAEMGRPLPE